MRVDVRIALERGMYVSWYHSENLHFIWASSWCFYHRENIFVVKPKKVLPKFLKLKWSYHMAHSCEAASWKPVWRYSLFCWTATLFPLAKVDVSGRCFSELPGKQTSLAEKYRWLTYLIFWICQVYPVVHILSHAWLEQTFLDFKRKVVIFLRKCYRKLLRC